MKLGKSTKIITKFMKHQLELFESSVKEKHDKIISEMIKDCKLELISLVENPEKLKRVWDFLESLPMREVFKYPVLIKLILLHNNFE